VSAAALLALIAAAGAAPDGRVPTVRAALVVEAQGGCPSGEAVRAALLPALTEAPAAGGQAPRVTDLGDRFQVDAAGQTGAFVDVARDCTERARVAAVFIALALSPPAAPERPEPLPTPPPPPRPPAPPQSVRWFEIAVEARLDGASLGAPAKTTLAWGGEVRGALGRGAVGIAATAGLLAPTDDAFGSVGVRQQRFPFSLSLTLGRQTVHGLGFAADLGLAAVPFTLEGRGLSSVAPATRIDLGARLALALRLPALTGRLAPVLGLHAEYFPRPYQFSVDPLGDIGSSSGLWLGASLGLSYLSR
jgi:hypothetical protein